MGWKLKAAWFRYSINVSNFENFDELTKFGFLQMPTRSYKLYKSHTFFEKLVIFFPCVKNLKFSSNKSLKIEVTPPPQASQASLQNKKSY